MSTPESWGDSQIGKFPHPLMNVWDAAELTKFHKPVEQPPDLPSYIIYKIGNVVYVKNGRTGTVEYSSSDAADVMQYAIDNLPNIYPYIYSGKIFIKAGEYRPSRTVNVNKAVIIQGEGPGNQLRTSSPYHFGTLINQAGYTLTFFNVTANNVIFRDLSFGGGNIAIAGGSRTSNILIRHLVLENIGVKWTYTLLDYYGYGAVLRNIYGYNAGASGVPFVNFEGAAGISGANCNYVYSSWFEKLAGICIQVKYGGPIFIRDSTFQSNQIGIQAVGKVGIVIDNCYFEENTSVDFKSLDGDQTEGPYYIAIMNSCFNASARPSLALQFANVNYKANQVLLLNNVFARSVGNLGDLSGINPGNLLLINNRNKTGTGTWLNVPSGTKAVKDYTFVTQNSGTATIAAGTTSVTVAHGLSSPPNKVIVTPRANIGSVWVSARDSTNITINCSTAPTANVVVDWEAEA